MSEATGSPEVFACVKTLHPTVHGGILYRRDLDEHQREAEAHGVVPIDVVAVNLYPFQDTVAREGVTEPEAVEQIDIGGPTMVRAAAKNFRDVTVVVSPDDYNAVADALAARPTSTRGGTSRSRPSGIPPRTTPRSRPGWASRPARGFAGRAPRGLCR